MSWIGNTYRWTLTLLLLTLVTLSSAKLHPTSKDGILLPRKVSHWGLSRRLILDSSIVHSKREFDLKNWETLVLRGGSSDEENSSDYDDNSQDEEDSDVENDDDEEDSDVENDDEEEDTDVENDDEEEDSNVETDSESDAETESDHSDSDDEVSSDDDGEESDDTSNYEEESDDEDEESEPETSISTKSNRRSISVQSRASSSDVEEYDEPLSFTPMQDMGVTLGVMILCNRLDLNNAKIVKMARFAFIAYLVVAQIFLIYVRYKAHIINDTTPITINNALSSIVKSQMSSGGTGGMGGDMVKNLANSFLSSESTIVDYDLLQAKNMNNSLLIPMVMLWFLHFKMGQVQPLLHQAVSGVKELVVSPLFQVYILGRNLERPFKNKKLDAMQKQHEEATSGEDQSNDENGKVVISDEEEQDVVNSTEEDEADDSSDEEDESDDDEYESDEYDEYDSDEE